MTYIAHTEDYKGYTIKIVSDDDPMNPYEDWDMLGELFQNHRNWGTGTSLRNMDSEEIQEKFDTIKKEGGVIVPIYMYEHGGYTISTGAFSCSWDSGQVGVWAVTSDEIRKEYSVKRISKKTREKVERVINSQVEVLDDYLTGNVYGFIVEKNGVEIDSCWGFFGDYNKSGVIDEARSIVDWEEKSEYPLLAHAGLLAA